MTEYTIIIEDAGDETLQLMEEALALHIEMLRDMGEPIPESHVRAAVVQIAS
jgi:predicted RNase H-like HicB family nuclease